MCSKYKNCYERSTSNCDVRFVCDCELLGLIGTQLDTKLIQTQIVDSDTSDSLRTQQGSRGAQCGHAESDGFKLPLRVGKRRNKKTQNNPCSKGLVFIKNSVWLL